MVINLDHKDLNAIHSAVGSVLKAGKSKEADLKPNSIEFRTLQVNKEIIEKLEYAGNRLTRVEDGVTIIGSNSVDVELNRVQSKVLLATMFLTSDLQKRALKEYEKRPVDHPAFQDVEGRRKVDYETRLKQRMEEVDIVVTKIRKAL